MENGNEKLTFRKRWKKSYPLSYLENGKRKTERGKNSFRKHPSSSAHTIIMSRTIIHCRVAAQFVFVHFVTAANLKKLLLISSWFL